MIPITLTDSRRWHWDPEPEAASAAGDVARLVALSARTAVRIQVCAIYVHASVAKMAVREWSDGTALFYWLRHPTFGLNGAFRPLLEPLLVNGYTVSAVTWSVIVLEFFLCMGLIATRPARRLLLALGILFHASIIVFQGLFSFGIVMFAALLLYLWPWEDEIPWATTAAFTRRYAALRSQLKRRRLTAEVTPPLADHP